MPVVRLDVPRRRQRHRRVYTECPMCIYLHHLSHICTTLRNGPFWMLAGAVLVLFFLPLGPFLSGPFWFAWAVFDFHWGRFGDGPFWSVPVKTCLKSLFHKTSISRTFNAFNGQISHPYVNRGKQ